MDGDDDGQELDRKEMDEDDDGIGQELDRKEMDGGTEGQGWGMKMGGNRMGRKDMDG